MKILEFNTQAAAKSALTIINNIASAYWKSQGYTVVDGENGKELIGKKNGVDNPDAARTVTWDVVKESPDGTFYVQSPSNVSSFSNWRDNLNSEHNIPEDKEFPDTWVKNIKNTNGLTLTNTNGSMLENTTNA